MQLDLRQPPASAFSRPERQSGLIGLIETWFDRARFREELALMARDTPERIDDIGLTMEQARTEIAKPFWRR
ncbi:DUF1127 domain-containing protein [Mesorhizobium waimense]|uniref:DUF1127 domain-containing protein n=1 Tax=Mesorhizobium waimense TaxID=1300307 RepID=A0A3A5KMT1_9HYPH|nr:DUF1127 domain-containing protein [Mesorhizobium waimense]